MPHATGRATITVTVLAAAVRVGAAMPPAKALKLPADHQRPPVEVDVLPAQTESFTLPQPKGQGHAPPGAIASGRSESDEPSRFIEGQRLDLVVAGGRGVNQGGDVASDIPALQRNLERADRMRCIWRTVAGARPSPSSRV